MRGSCLVLEPSVEAGVSSGRARGVAVVRKVKMRNSMTEKRMGSLIVNKEIDGETGCRESGTLGLIYGLEWWSGIDAQVVSG